MMLGLLVKWSLLFLRFGVLLLLSISKLIGMFQLIHGNCIGIGLVARNSRGECVGAKCVCLFVKGNSRVAESLAALHAVFFSKFLKLRDVIFEGDSSQVVAEINSSPPHLSIAGHITESILQELKDLRSSSFVHVRRASNAVAHVLAREAMLKNLNVRWRSDFPCCIQDLIVREKSFP